MRALADLHSALRSLGAREIPVIAVSSIPPPAGIGELVDALDAHRAAIDLPGRRLRARRLHALADFSAEHGQRGLRELGGRRAAERWLEQQDPGLDVAALGRVLAMRASESS